jgi:hypothetical protein
MFKKAFKILIPGLLVLLSSCKDGYIDDISKVAPGEDVTAPVVTVTYPTEGTKIKVNEEVTSININFEVTDDIEIATVTIKLDNQVIATFDDFLDYRILKKEFLYENLTTGTHVLSISAVDIDGKTTTKEVNFEKEPAYTPVYNGEIFYMPFDGNYVELVSITFPTTVGTPSFSTDAVAGTNSYAGAANAYLTFPASSLTTGNEFSAAFWMKVNANPDRAGVLVIGPPDDANPDAQNKRTSGFRFFRENAGGKQRFKLNVGTGAGEAWFDGGAAADVDPALNEWVHLAFTISPTQSTVYINGNIVSQGNFAGIDWAGCDILSIMSGAPRFTGWDHKSDASKMDELRLFNKTLSQAEVQNVMQTSAEIPYDPKYDGEIFYMPFDGTNSERISKIAPTAVGSPGFAGEGVKGGNAYAGAADSYLTFPGANLQSSELSASFWLKVNAVPDRAGILVMSREDTGNPSAQNIRTSGFRFFRENAGGKQRFKLNVGNGTGDNWFDGGAAADVDPTTNEWVHFAFTISGSQCVVYINGEVVSQGGFTGIDWTGCDMLSIMSGAPRFTEWGHHSDLSYMDELRFFNKALSQNEVQTIMND